MSKENAGGWPLVDLRTITTKIGSGATPRGGKESYKDDGITLIRSLNVYDFTFDYNGLAHIDEAQARELSNVEVKQHDILLNITGASVARCCMVPDKILPARVNQHVALVRASQIFANPHYLLYVINSPHYKHRLLMLAQGGATREALTKETIENFTIPLPPLPIQQKIAAILSAYDDLIENNTRRIAILEEMAQALYREWFVHFRFPGHEKKRMVESALGMVPEGWEVVSFTDMVDVLSGGTPKTTISEYWNGEIPFFTPKDVSSTFYVTETERSITDYGLKSCNSKLYPKNTVFITARGTVGKVVLASTNMAMSQSSYALRGKNGLDRFFTFLLTRNCIDQLRQNSHGAVFDTIIVDTFVRLRVIKPSTALIKTFSPVVEPIFEEILNLLHSNINLRQTRDLLLPKLIAGEVDVEELEIAEVEMG